jgi:putative ABC transport system permease protein
MRTSIALSNIRHHAGRTALSLGGIGIAVVLVFMQLGFLGAVENTATTIYSKLQFDLVLRSPEYLHLAIPRQIQRSALTDAAGHAMVQRVVPFHVTMAFWRHPDGATLRGMVLMGIDPSEPTFNDPAVTAHFDRLTFSEALLIDQRTHREYGPRDGRRFGPQDIGVVTDVQQRRVEIVGVFRLGSGLTANGAAIVDEEGFDRLDPQNNSDFVSLGLVSLKEGADPEVVAQELQQRFRTADGTPAIEVLTRPQVIRRELTRWIAETPIGFIFTMGVAISLVVGGAIVYMILSTDVANRIREYATLKAMGYTNSFLSGIVLQQAGYLAVLSFVPAMAASTLFYGVTAWLTNLPIFMTLARIVFVFGLTVAMCLISAFLAIRKLWQADPAELF